MEAPKVKYDHLAPATETAWLIELKQSVSKTPHWYGTTDEGVLGWTSDSLQAVRFSRKVDAEKVMEDLDVTEAFVCEHAWHGEPSGNSG